MKNSRMKMVAISLLLTGATVVSADESLRWHLEGGHGRIDVAPTFLDRNPALFRFERQIPDISSGRNSWLEARWDAGERWYWSGRYERLRLEYHNPLTLTCPHVIFRVDPAFCFLMPFEWPARDGFIHDDVDHGQLKIGYRQPFGRWVGGFAELGYGLMRWDSKQDLEAMSVVRCRNFEGPVDYRPGDDVYVNPFDVPGCQSVDTRAKSDGLLFVVGLEAELPFGFDAKVSWHHQGYRHVIYRNQVLTEVNEANRSLCPEGCAQTGVFLHQPQGSWDWLRARLGYSFNARFGVFLEAETSGSRDWNVYSGGLRFSF